MIKEVGSNNKELGDRKTARKQSYQIGYLISNEIFLTLFHQGKQKADRIMCPVGFFSTLFLD